jgi:mRNA interferase MazF
VKRGDLYRVAKPSSRDPKRFRVFVVVSRQVLIESKFSTVVCAPVYSSRHGLSTQVPVGIQEGLRHDSSIHCDELVSLPKAMLTHFVGRLGPVVLDALDRALVAALGIDVTRLEGHSPTTRAQSQATNVPRWNCLKRRASENASRLWAFGFRRTTARRRLRKSARRATHKSF